MKKILLVVSLLFCLSLADDEELNLHKSFNLTKNQLATIDIKDKKVIITVGKKKIELKNPPEFEDMEFILNRMGEDELIKIGDYNFDGYNDIAIANGIGYGGVNIFRNYYFFDPKSITFHNYISDVNTLKIEGKLLTTQTKDGPFYYETHYKIKKLKPYKALEKQLIVGIADRVEEFDTKGKVIKKYFDPAYLTITSKKAYFYKGADDSKKTKGYIIKGDKVKILEIDASYSWVKIEYKNRKKSFKRWIKTKSIEEVE